MEWLQGAVDLVLHLDRHLEELIRVYGAWTYVVLFLIVFCETGFVITPFLPGDSLLFGAGALAAIEGRVLRIEWLLLWLMIAAILGDTVNYWIGRWVGPRAFSGRIPLLKQTHLERTQQFYARYGGKTIILARFVPIVRTFAPFVAGVGLMNYRLFVFYNIVGGITWVVLCTLAGYHFGNIPWVKQRFEVVIVAIVVISVLPVFWEVYVERRRRRAEHLQMAGVTAADQAQQTTT
ncbi:MAG: membrane protein [Planctomycetaceae bacterium]|nr:MAG: membrane protein [Planctomycetaceae bacterium]